MANKGSIFNGLKERITFNILANVLGRLVVNTSNGLQVTLAGTNNVGTVTTVTTVSTVTAVTTCSTLTNLTNWGIHPAQAYSQMESAIAYNTGFRRNILN